MLNHFNEATHGHWENRNSKQEHDWAQGALQVADGAEVAKAYCGKRCEREVDCNHHLVPRLVILKLVVVDKREIRLVKGILTFQNLQVVFFLLLFLEGDTNQEPPHTNEETEIEDDKYQLQSPQG